LTLKLEIRGIKDKREMAGEKIIIKRRGTSA